MGNFRKRLAYEGGDVSHTSQVSEGFFEFFSVVLLIGIENCGVLLREPRQDFLQWQLCRPMPKDKDLCGVYTDVLEEMGESHLRDVHVFEGFQQTKK